MEAERMERMGKLPKWAQTEFLVMENELARLRKLAYPEGRDAWCFTLGGRSWAPIAFGQPSSYDAVRLSRGVSCPDHFTITLSADGTSININASQGISIIPKVSNSIDVVLRDAMGRRDDEE